MQTDILIVGSGCSGLYSALKLPRDKHIVVITKSDLESSDSFLAQGGMCTWKEEADYDSYFEDTMRAGHYENDRTSVEIMIKSSPKVVEALIGYGVDFNRDEKGELIFTKEGGHSANRILFHEDVTGKEITGKLLEQVKKLPNVEIYEYATMVDIIEKDNRCFGAVVRFAEGSVDTITAKYTILATGGVGGLYKHSTNFRHLTGDALAIAIKHGIELKNENYVQIHPTTLYVGKRDERRFLISESVRGEGAKLYNKNMERFVDELLPRDLLTQKIKEQMDIDGTEFVWEDLRPIPEEEIDTHFPNIVKRCSENGYDVHKECIPVVPAQHYFMGGIKVNHVSKTTMDCLYAVGETACNGVHGRNRLASNSLLESLVFAGRAAEDIAECMEKEHRESNAEEGNTGTENATRRNAKGENIKGENATKRNAEERYTKAENATKRNTEEGYTKAESATKRNTEEGYTKEENATKRNTEEGYTKEENIQKQDTAEGNAQTRSVATGDNMELANRLAAELDLNRYADSEALAKEYYDLAREKVRNIKDNS